MLAYAAILANLLFRTVEASQWEYVLRCHCLIGNTYLAGRTRIWQEDGGRKIGREFAEEPGTERDSMRT